MRKYLIYYLELLLFRLQGRQMCEFEKLVHKCSTLEISRVIHNHGKCSNLKHQIEAAMEGK